MTPSQTQEGSFINIGKGKQSRYKQFSRTVVSSGDSHSMSASVATYAFLVRNMCTCVHLHYLLFLDDSNQTTAGY